MLQRNEIISDYLLLSLFFLHLTAYNLQKMIDNLLLSQFFRDLAADYWLVFTKIPKREVVFIALMSTFTTKVSFTS